MQSFPANVRSSDESLSSSLLLHLNRHSAHSLRPFLVTVVCCHSKESDERVRIILFVFCILLNKYMYCNNTSDFGQDCGGMYSNSILASRCIADFPPSLVSCVVSVTC